MIDESGQSSGFGIMTQPADTITAIKKALEGVNAAFLRVLAEAPADAAHFSIGLDAEGQAIRIQLDDMRSVTELLSTLESLQRENEELRNGPPLTGKWKDEERARLWEDAFNKKHKRAEAAEAEVKRYRAALSEIATNDEYRILTAKEAQTVAQKALSSTGDTHGN